MGLAGRARVIVMFDMEYGKTITGEDLSQGSHGGRPYQMLGL